MPRDVKCVSDLRETGAIEAACRERKDERIARANVLEAMSLNRVGESQNWEHCVVSQKVRENFQMKVLNWTNWQADPSYPDLRLCTVYSPSAWSHLSPK
jgi:hypothetical protein